MYIPMIAFMECLLVEDKIVKRVKFRNQFVFYGHSCIKQMYLGELEPIPSSTDQCGMFSKGSISYALFKALNVIIDIAYILDL